MSNNLSCDYCDKPALYSVAYDDPASSGRFTFRCCQEHHDLIVLGMPQELNVRVYTIKS